MCDCLVKSNWFLKTPAVFFPFLLTAFNNVWNINMRAFVAVVVRIILFIWWFWAELKPKYYIVNNLKANKKCKLLRELLNCMMALYPLMNELAYQTIMLSVWFKQSSLTLWSAQYNGTKQTIGTKKNGNWNASTVLICFTFFNQGSLISATAMYIALRLISLSSLLLFVLLAFIICLFPHCPLGDRLALPCFPEFRASPPFVHVPCSRMVITDSKFWIHLSVLSTSTCCDYWSAHCHAYSQSSSKNHTILPIYYWRLSMCCVSCPFKNGFEHICTWLSNCIIKCL